MGQVPSRLSSYFSDEKESSAAGVTSSTTNGSCTAYSRHNANSSSSSKEPRSSSLASPRAALKRSRFSWLSSSFSNYAQESLPSAKRFRLDEDQYLDFPFLLHNETISYYKNSKMLIILRGLPGSGKSVIATHLFRKYIKSTLCSVDLFFTTKDGKYVYDPDLLHEALKRSQRCSIGGAMAETPVIIIDSTNLVWREMKFYADLAKEYGYITVVAEPRTPWRRDALALAEKNSHGFAVEAISSKMEAMEEFAPYYFGWFLNDKDSHLLLRDARWFVESAWQDEVFRKDFGSRSGVRSAEDLIAFFKKPGKELTLHCTAKFIGRNLSEENEEYMKRVEKFVGQVFEIEVVGFVLTPRTFGARVKLSPKQLDMWAMNDWEDVPEAFWEVSGGFSHEFAGFPVKDTLRNGIIQNGHANQTNGTEVNIDEDDALENGVDKMETDNSIDDSFIVSNISHFDNIIPTISTQEEESFNELFSQNNSKSNRENGDLEDLHLSLNGRDENASTAENSPHQETSDLPDTDTLIAQSEKPTPPTVQPSAADLSPQMPASENAEIPSSIASNPSQNVKEKQRNRKSFKNLSIPSNSRTVEQSSTKPTLSYEHLCHSLDSWAKGSRAHFTLGCAPEVGAVTTGIDLIMVGELEREASTEETVKSDDDQTNGNSCPSTKLGNLKTSQAAPPDLHDNEDLSGDLKNGNSTDETPPDANQSEKDLELIFGKSPCRKPLHVISNENGEIRNYGYGVWVFYPDEKLVFNSVFSAWL